MLTKITIRNFKLFNDVEIPLGNSFVFVGPNNSGKTSALQALTLWRVGLQKWANKYDIDNPSSIPGKRPGVTVNRLDLISLPVAEMDLMWFRRKVRKGSNQNIRIDLIVDGVSNEREWQCGLELDYANDETFYCRPLRISQEENPERMIIPKEAIQTKIAFLPAMSGLATEEAIIEEGRINVLIGQGQTAGVLRNLCYRVYSKSDKADWNSLVKDIETLFGVTLNDPVHLSNRGSVTMNYTDQNGNTTLELPSSGRGMQQVLLLLAYIYDNTENTVFLLDEPDAHLEILRQKQVYDLISEVAEQRNSQIISASHSEVLLNQAAQRNSAISFVGDEPHLLGRNKVAHVRRALAEIGHEYYYGAEQKGWILYLEGETDLRILQAFAKKTQHPSERILQNPLVKYVGNRPNNARENFHALKEAKDDLRGFLLLDRTEKPLQNAENLSEFMWKKNEIENYLCNYHAIISYVTDGLDRGDLFSNIAFEDRENIMNKEIEKFKQAFKTLHEPDPFSDDIKASDKFLTPLFVNFTKKLKKSSMVALQKKDFYKLVEHIPQEEIDHDIKYVLDEIVKVAEPKSE